MMDGRVKTLHPKVHGGLARRARQSRACRGDGGAWDRADRPRRGQPLPVPQDRDERRRPRHDHREYRHRRPVDGALGGEEPCPCRDRHRSRPIMPRCWPSSTPTAAARRSNSARSSRPRPIALTAAYDSTISQWFAFADQGERWPADLDARVEAQDAAALRREPAPAGGALPARRPGRARHRPGRAGPGQGAQLQQSQRRQRRARAGRRVPRRRRRPSSSSSTPTPAASRRATRCSTPGREALACDSVSAFGGIVAVNRPLDAATAEAITGIFTEVVVAPDADEDAQRDLREEEESAPAADRRAARSGARRARRSR